MIVIGLGETMKCKKCSYEWKSKKENPKACPRCKARLDWR
jgi:predicted Zn-ribbon and HTH transcriptional regulator